MDGSLTGRLLVATPALDDPNFVRTVILLLDHDDDGALGLVLNRASEVEVLRAVEPWADLAAGPAVVFGGGPVEPDAVVALGRSRPGRLPDQVEHVVADVRLIDLSADPKLVAAEVSQIRIFAGYAGWAPGQLEAEIEAGAWFAVEATAEDVLTTDPERLWRRVLRRQSGELALFATFPMDPSQN